MSYDNHHDVVIRSRLNGESTEFVVVCGSSSQTLGGPFVGLNDALGFAMRHARASEARIFYEALDERGRAAGDRLLLRTAGA